jgi:hypothetical protein
MPSKDYRVWLSDFAYIVVELTMVRGRVVSLHYEHYLEDWQ